jgi:hypothetical protein
MSPSEESSLMTGILLKSLIQFICSSLIKLFITFHDERDKATVEIMSHPRIDPPEISMNLNILSSTSREFKTKHPKTIRRERPSQVKPPTLSTPIYISRVDNSYDPTRLQTTLQHPETLGRQYPSQDKSHTPSPHTLPSRVECSYKLARYDFQHSKTIKQQQSHVKPPTPYSTPILTSRGENSHVHRRLPINLQHTETLSRQCPSEVKPHIHSILASRGENSHVPIRLLTNFERSETIIKKLPSQVQSHSPSTLTLNSRVEHSYNFGRWLNDLNDLKQSETRGGQRPSQVKPPTPSTPILNSHVVNSHVTTRFLTNLPHPEILNKKRPSPFKIPTSSTPILTSCMFNSYIPARWSNNLQQHRDFFLSDLSPYDTDYKNIESKFNEYYTKHSIRIYRIQLIENKYLWLMFQLKKEEIKSLYGFCNEIHLFHGTKASNVDSICTKNFDWRLFGTNKGFKFGKGVSFSPRSSYASHFSDQNNNGNNKMFLVRVLQSKISYVGVKPPDLPPYGFDTTRNDKGTVIVKYDDHTFYPEYLITYTRTCPIIFPEIYQYLF